MKESRLPKGWIEVPLAEVGTWVGGGTPSKAEPRYWTNGSVPWVSPKDMKQATLYDAEDRITTLAVRESATQIVPAGSVLAVTRSGILRHTFPVAINTVPVALNQDLKAIIPHDGFDASYFAWVLRESERRILHECSKSGTTVQSVETSKLQAFRVPVAPPAEQRRIVAALEEHLSDLDTAVAGLERVQVNLERFRSAVLTAGIAGALSAKDVQNERLSYDSYSVFDLPDGWKWMALGEHLAAIKAGISFKCEERPPESGETGVVKVSAVTWGTYDEDQSKTVRDAERIDDQLLIEPGDFLFSRANTIQLVGACVIAKRCTRRVMLSDKILRFQFRGINPRWVLACLRSKWGRSEIERLATGNQESMRNIGQERIRAIRIPVPPDDEQARLTDEIERRLEAATHMALEVEVQLARSRRLRQSILKRAFEGKLVPQDPADEPASALLDRIHAERGTLPVSSARSRRLRATLR